jgi:hypothetical protein
LSADRARLQNLDQMHEELPKELATVNLLLNVLGFIPLLWLGAYIWACLPVKVPPPLEKLN